jgi:putative flippase GtrA
VTLEAKDWAKATLWTAAAAFTGFIASKPRVKLQQGLRQLPLRFIHTNTKPLATPLIRISLYGLVGMGAAIVHAGVLLGLSLLMPLWAANPSAFLAASIASYLGHARYTFRPETGGQRFARRWLVIQYAVNLSVCGVLPLVLPEVVPNGIRLGILVFIPTVLNALIWSKAARFSAKQRNKQQPTTDASR